MQEEQLPSSLFGVAEKERGGCGSKGASQEFPMWENQTIPSWVLSATSPNVEQSFFILCLNVY